MRVKMAELARLADVSRQAVSKNVKAGILTLDPGGLVDLSDPLNAAWAGRHGVGETLPEAVEQAPEHILELFADFGDGMIPVVKYGFSADLTETDTVIFPVPEAVKIDLDFPEPQIYTLDGRILPSRAEASGRGLNLTRERYIGA